MLFRTLLILLLILAQAAPLSRAQNPSFLPLKSIALPESLGKVETVYEGSSSRWVIQIQDVHANLPAQENIAAITEHLNEFYGISTVGLEGNWSATLLPQTWGLPPSAEKQMLLRALLEEDYITGPVFTAAFSKYPVQLAGLEEESLYEENRKLYLQFLENEENTKKKLSVLEKSIQAVKQNVFNPDLLTFDHSLLLFRKGKKAESFIPRLLKTAAEKEIDLSDLKNIQTFLKAEEVRKSLDKTKLEGEAKRLVEAFKHENLSFEALLKSGKIPEDKIQHYPQTLRFLEYQKLQEALPHQSFFSEIEAAVVRVQEKLLQTSEERELSLRSEAFELAQKIILLQVSLSELEKFKQIRHAAEADLRESSLIKEVENGLAFYDIALKRDEVFFRQITENPLLKGDVAVVTGGFHTEGLSAQLQKAGISYAVITPSLGEKPEPNNETLYHERLREDLIKAQTLSELRGRVTDALDRGIVRGVNVLKTERNRIKAVNTAVTYVIGPPAAGRQSQIPAASSEEFSKLSTEKKQTLIESMIETQSGTKRITAVLKQSTLQKLLRDPAALAVWHREILPNRANTIILVKDSEDIFTDRIGKASIKPVPGDFQSVVKRESEKAAASGEKIGVIEEGFQASGAGTIVLPEHPMSLFLVRPVLENQRIDFSSLETLNAVQEILAAIYEARAVQEAA